MGVGAIMMALAKYAGIAAVAKLARIAAGASGLRGGHAAEVPSSLASRKPTLDEAKEAISELIYLSSSLSSGSIASFSSPQETKACINHESSVINVAEQAFSLLERPDVQTVVASITCDPNVWDAIIQNSALIEFLKSQKNDANFEEQVLSPKDSVASSEAREPRNSDSFTGTFHDAKGPGKSDVFKDFVQNVIMYIFQEIVINSLSNFTQSLFSESDTEKKSGSSDEKKRENSYGTYGNFFTGSRFMPLVLKVVMIVLMKWV